MFERYEIEDKTFLVRKDTLDKYIVDEVLKEKTYLNNIVLNSSQTWLDIGANIGAFSCAIGPNIKEIYAFEPEAENHYMLTYNVTINNLKEKIKIYNKALVDNDEPTINFYKYNGKNKGSHTTLTTQNANRETIIVAAQNLSKFVMTLDAPINIKMDIEGGEYSLIKNLSKYNLLSKIDQIIFEYHFTFLEDWPDQKKFEEILGILRCEYGEKNIKIIEEDNEYSRKYQMRIVSAHR